MTTSPTSRTSLRRFYDNPPIEEAVCEFRLPPSQQWDAGLGGMLVDKVSHVYPLRETKTISEIIVVENDARLLTPQFLALLSNDRRKFCQIGSNVPRFSIHELSPYTKWEVFLSNIQLVLTEIVAKIKVEPFQRLGLRYVNKIVIPESNVILSNYFRFFPTIPKDIARELSEFIVGVVFPYDSGENQCRIQLNPIPSANALSSSFVLDLDYFTAKPGVVKDSEAALSWAETAHTRIEEIFENIILDPLRELFGEKKSG